MSLLLDALPETVCIDGVDVRINSDFRTGVLFEQLMFDDDCPESVKPDVALRLFYPVIPLNRQKAIDKLVWFYRGGDVAESNGSGSGSRCYDFDHDDVYFYAAFLQQYGIDLTRDRLHWWQFRALFLALTDSCELVKIMGYRSMKIDSNMSASERQYYSRMKRLYALPRSRSEQEKINELEEMLMGKTNQSNP
jgi:hypothetical protein